MASVVPSTFSNNNRERSLRPSAGQLTEDLRPGASHALASVVDNPHLTHVTANAIDVACQAHALGNIVSEAPEVDDIADCAQRRRVLDQGRLEACCF